jgi:acyl-CoA synthetase (AMP-forming)/AMP-acid ligase II
MNWAIDFLIERFQSAGESPAFIYREKKFSFSWFAGRIDFWTARLKSDGISPGDVVGLAGDYSPEICALLLALIRYGTIAVPYASVTGREKGSLDELADLMFEYIFDSEQNATIKSYCRTVKHPLIRTLTDRRAPGLIVFSSGSTGVQKGIIHDFVRILEKFKVHRKSLRTLTFLQLDHLGGINTLFYVLSNAGTVITVSDRTPATICAAVQTHRIELLPVTPSFLNMMILSGEYAKWDMSSLKVISYGTEVMPETTLQKVREIFPMIQLQQTYGLSELGVLRTKSREDGSLWVKVGGEGFQTKIVNDTLWIKAESAMLGYLNAPNPFDNEGWFNTEDQVEIDGDYLRILGRKSEIINVGGQKVFPSEVEETLMQMENVQDVAVRGEKNALMGNIVVARLNLIKTEDSELLRKRVRDFCRGRLSPYKIPVKVEIATETLLNARYKKMRRGETKPC